MYAVWALLAEHGAEAVTMRQVAAEANVSLGRVQHYFATKDALLQHACRAVVDLAAGQYVDRTHSLSAVASVRALLLQPIPRDAASRVGAAVWQSFLTLAASDPGIRTIVVEAVEGARQELARMIIEAQQDGSLRQSLDPGRTARSLFALSYGLSQQVLIGAVDADEARATAEAALATLTPGPDR